MIRPLGVHLSMMTISTVKTFGLAMSSNLNLEIMSLSVMKSDSDSGILLNGWL